MEEILAYRGILVSHESLRQWTFKFGQSYAKALRRQQPQRGDQGHLDEVMLTINGRHQYLWRAVDQNGYTLDLLVQSRRNRTAAQRFFCKLLKGLRDVSPGSSSPTNSRAMRGPNGRSCPASNTDSTKA